MTGVLRTIYSLLVFLTGTGSAWASGGEPEGTVVPEPSSLLIAGLCGILFLFWRSK